MAVTLFWMDMIRDRIKSFPYKNNKEKKLIKEFMAPIVLMGNETERDLRKSLARSLKETKHDCHLASQALYKELKKMEQEIDWKKAKCFFCGKFLDRGHKDFCVVKKREDRDKKVI